MFDKNEDFVVVKLEQVSHDTFLTPGFAINGLQILPMSFGPDQLPRPGAAVTE